MILTLHLTDNCNMDCDYCIHEKKNRDMSVEVLDAACDYIFTDGRTAGLSFFGGEPLIKRNLIIRALEKCTETSKKTGIKFKSRMTTNGVLLDDKFIELAKKYNVTVDLSFDGLAQNICRHMADGSDSFELIEANAKKLLKANPKAYALLTIAPQAAEVFCESIKYIYSLGFRYMTATIAYGERVDWTDEKLVVIKEQLEEIADFYFDKCVNEKDPFFFSPFDGKTADLIAGKNPAERCHLGRRQMPVDIDGKIYPCNQFVGDTNYYMGNVFDGLDKEAWMGILKRSINQKEADDCLECELRNRCTHTCGCTNRMQTGDEMTVSPLQCAYEKMIIELSDMVADRIMEADMEAFMKKYKINTK